METLKSSASRADTFADLDEPAAPRDFDPEDELAGYSSSDKESSQDEQLAAPRGKEHYEKVGKSQLRRGESANLGPQYAGSRVSRRAATLNTNEHDPFAGYDDEESDGEQDGLHLDRPNGRTRRAYASEESDESGENGLDTEYTSMSDGQEDDQDDHNQDDMQADREQLRKLMRESNKSVAASIAQANKADAEKGKAVKLQRQTFDKLLNGRIRLQQALVATNSMQALQEENKMVEQSDEAVQAAEDAALKLWNNLAELRQAMDDARTGSKRKRFEATSETASAEMLSHMNAQEKEAIPNRRKILQKWSTKTQDVTAQPTSQRLNNAPRQRTIIDVLEEQLGDKERLIKRTRMPRSCAPVQASKRISEDENIFDDADFYGLMLKELLERRNIDSASNVEVAQATKQYQAARDAKTRKNVDTKASKGRKMRYTVHEKLQNFMAPDNRGTWADRQIDELFGSLLGKRMALVENDVDQEDDTVGEEDALMLFRN